MGRYGEICLARKAERFRAVGDARNALLTSRTDALCARTITCFEVIMVALRQTPLCAESAGGGERPRKVASSFWMAGTSAAARGSEAIRTKRNWEGER